MGIKNDDFFGGLFDFDGDGETDFSEQFIAFKIMEEMKKEEEKEEDESFDWDSSNEPLYTVKAMPEPEQPAEPAPAPEPTQTAEKMTLEKYRMRGRETKEPERAQPPEKPDLKLPDKLTLEEYRALRKERTLSIPIVLLIFLPILAMGGGILLSLFRKTSNVHDLPTLVAFPTMWVILGVLGVVFFVGVVKLGLDAIVSSFQRAQEGKGIFLRSASEEEIKTYQKEKIIQIVAALVIVAALLRVIAG